MNLSSIQFTTFEPILFDENNGTLNKTMDYIFDRLYIRVIFITLYSIVFCLCVFGNLLVILGVTLSRRLRPITNFFLANLAVADFCVGIFCVFQNLSMYLISSWILGDFLCKMYYFVNTLSYTASIFILVVICTERYFAIIYPITCKQILTPRRLRLVILGVWLTSALYSSPKFLWYNVITVEGEHGNETICINNRMKYNTEIFDIVNFVLLYVIPLALMSLLYTRIAIRLWRSSAMLEKQLNASNTISYQGLTRSLSGRQKQQLEAKMSNGDSKQQSIQAAAQQSFLPNPNSSQNVLRARRGVIRMLIIVVLAFALCNLPLHARKMWQYWSTQYRGYTTFSALFTPLTFLVTYFNSGINPLLYAFLSRNFRRGMREILLCTGLNRRRPSMRNQFTMGLKGMHRQASTRSTMKNATTVTMLNNDPSSECSHEV
ncbi:trissin receptor [Onthophagus taurus]|uniref:trissin receptor n=1 Tax=Onthophagus taurus TaxID=166361 RepID=UPI000C20B5A6|nr:trissin receptor-like [Onthophagus taurus]